MIIFKKLFTRCLFILFVFNCQPASASSPHADTIFIGGDIITVDETMPEAEALCVSQGKIMAIGREKDILAHKGSDTRIIDLEGRTLMPGFIDIHTHPILSAMMGEIIDIAGFTGLIVEVGAIKKFTRATPKFSLPAYLYLLTKQMEVYSKAGYTTIVAPGLQPIIPDHILSSKTVAEHPDTPVRVLTYPLFDKLAATPFLPDRGNMRFKVMGPKFWIDGSPYAGGMAMREPYLDNDFTRNKLGIKRSSHL